MRRGFANDTVYHLTLARAGPHYSFTFVGAFTKLRKATISFVSFRPHWTARYPLGRIFMISDIRGLLESLSRHGRQCHVESCVFSSRGLRDGSIARPEESEWVVCVWVWSWNLTYDLRAIKTLFAVRTTWRIHIDTIEDKSFTTFVRVNSILKSEELSPLIERSFQRNYLRPGTDLPWR
jgi:hypothetical protein